MSDILAIRVRNLRSLRDTGFIELRPITILVGRNSAGKSTFARLLPLLRQTAEVRKRAPILWWGRFVDFGSFGEAVNRFANPREIEIAFRVTIDRANSAATAATFRKTYEEVGPQVVEVSLTLLESSNGKETRLAKIDLKRENDQYCITFNDDGDSIATIVINDYTWSPPERLRQEVIFSSVLPTLQFLEERTVKTQQGDTKAIFVTDPFRSELIKTMFNMSFVHGNTSFESVSEIIQQLDPDDPNRLLALMRSVGISLPSWVTTVADLTTSSRRFSAIRNRLLARDLRALMSQVDEAISSAAGRCSYLEPLRATAERYYRKQELAVAEVDSKGSNVPFFLDSLTSTERDRFDQWMTEHLQAGIKTSSEGGHLTIRFKDSSGIEANLADVGFGFSQILPVALQLWSVSQQRSVRARFKRQMAAATVVVEQPELHLHPEYQAKIADLLRSTTLDKKVRLIVETHSPSLVNKLGLLIADGSLQREDVQVLRFDREETASVTSVSTSSFDEAGVLIDWPYGFFDA